MSNTTLRQIRLEKLRAEHPELFTPSGNLKRTPLDLRKFQTSLLAEQRAARSPHLRPSVLARHDRRRHALRDRPPLPADAKAISAKVDKQGRLYFTLGNGQRVRADRATDRQHFDPETGRFDKGRRRLPINGVLGVHIIDALRARKEAA